MKEKMCKCGHREFIHSDVGCWSKDGKENQFCDCKKFSEIVVSTGAKK